KTNKKCTFPDFHRVDGVVCDEGHQIKNGDSRRTQAAKAVVLTCKPRLRIVMSGTPIENKNAELISPLEFLGVLDQLGGWFGYATKYCGGKRTRFGWDLSKSTNSTELYERLSRICYLRRLKADVIAELPDKLETVVDCEVSNTAELNQISNDLETFLMNKSGRLLSEAQLKTQAMMKVNMLRSAVGRGKVEWISDWIDEFLESGEK